MDAWTLGRFERGKGAKIALPCFLEALALISLGVFLADEVHRLGDNAERPEQLGELLWR